VSGELEPHPFAEAFPMLPDDELAELADDIRANGLRHPIVLYQDRILDGRNRYAACQRHRVAPEFVKFDGDDKAALALVLSDNYHRRNVTKSQRAMAYVAAESVLTSKDKRGESHPTEAARAVGVGTSLIERARYVARHAPGLVSEVTAGHVTVSDAHQKAQAAERLAREQANTEAELQADTPDLYAEYAAGQIDLKEARQRHGARKSAAQSCAHFIVKAVTSLRDLHSSLDVDQDQLADAVRLNLLPTKDWPDLTAVALHVADQLASLDERLTRLTKEDTRV
jgi:ParB-like chromosome segregation protein Spo0J